MYHIVFLVDRKMFSGYNLHITPCSSGTGLDHHSHGPVDLTDPANSYPICLKMPSTTTTMSLKRDPKYPTNITTIMLQNAKFGILASWWNMIIQNPPSPEVRIEVWQASVVSLAFWIGGDHRHESLRIRSDAQKCVSPRGRSKMASPSRYKQVLLLACFGRFRQCPC